MAGVMVMVMEKVMEKVMVKVMERYGKVEVYDQRSIAQLLLRCSDREEIFCTCSNNIVSEILGERGRMHWSHTV